MAFLAQTGCPLPSRLALQVPQSGAAQDIGSEAALRGKTGGLPEPGSAHAEEGTKWLFSAPPRKPQPAHTSQETGAEKALSLDLNLVNSNLNQCLMILEVGDEKRRSNLR